jgi:hypothetical protein
MRITLPAAVAIGLVALTDVPAFGQNGDMMSPDKAREENAYTLGVQAYLWGFPLYFYRTANAEGLKAGGVGLNSFHKFTTLKTAKDRFVVTPNNVTIDAYAIIDVSKEPVVLRVPALSEPRWYIVQMGDSFDEIFLNIGGTKGPEPGTYVVTGPDFQGILPGEMIHVTARTKIDVMAVRIFVKGDADLSKAVDAQKGFFLMPLSAYLSKGLAFNQAKIETPAPVASEAPTEIRFFDLLGKAMQEMLPATADNSDQFVAGLHQIGLSAGKGFEWRAIDEPTKNGLARAAKTGEEIVDARWQATGEVTNGWRYTMGGGRAGYDFALRAALAKNQLGAQLAEQVLYPNTQVDDKGQPLNGANKYVLHFVKDQIPPVATFWNLAMYDKDNFFVENDFGRYSIGSTTDGLKTGPDGSITISIQNDRPTDTSNWLPAPKGPFNLTMRLYGPQTTILDGSYRLPAVQRTE